MESTTIKVTTTTRDRIKAIGSQRHESADKVISAALDELDRKLFWDDYDAAARADPAPRASTEWERTLTDGLGE